MIFRRFPKPPPAPDFSDLDDTKRWLTAMREWNDQAGAHSKNWRRWDRRYGWAMPVSMLVFSAAMVGWNFASGAWWVAPVNVANFAFNIHLLRKWRNRQREAILQALS